MERSEQPEPLARFHCLLLLVLLVQLERLVLSRCLAQQVLPVQLELSRCLTPLEQLVPFHYLVLPEQLEQSEEW